MSVLLNEIRYSTLEITESKKQNNKAGRAKKYSHGEGGRGGESYDRFQFIVIDATF